MKNLLSAVVGVLSSGILFFGVSQAAVLEDAILWGYEEGLTSFSTTSSFRAYDSLRRDEAAKFLIEFSNIYGSALSNSTTNCSFNDLDKSRPDLQNYVSQACQKGILQGSNGKVMPDQQLTNAQIVTTVVRIMAGYQSEYNVTHWADNYYKKAQELWLDMSKFWDKDAATTRGNVIMLLYNAKNWGNSSYESSSNTEMDKILQELLDILEG